MMQLKRVKWIWLAAVFMAFVMVGCEIEEEEEDEEPPPPSAAEISGAIRQAYQGLNQYNQRFAGIPQEEKQEALQGVAQARSQYQATPHGPEGISQAAQELEGLIREARNNEAWDLVVFAVDALQTLEPGNTRFERDRERAELYRNLPQLEITGFFDDPDTGAVTVFMNVTLPQQGRTEQVQARPGDEFHGLEMREIIGRNQGIRVEYLPTGDEYEVMMRQ